MCKLKRIAYLFILLTTSFRCLCASEILPPLPVEIWNIFPDMGALGDFVNLNVINPKTFYSVLVVDLVIIIPAIILYLHMKKEDTLVPGRIQSFFEFIVESFDGLVKDSMGVEKAGKFMPFIGTLFLFVFLSNIIGLIPISEFTIGGFWFPGLTEPTKDYNVPGGLAVLFVILIGHGSIIYYKGILGYINEYFSPIWILFPLNIAGKFAEFVSISFRLFGNIFGGVVVIGITFSLPKLIQLPGGISHVFALICTFLALFLNFFFGIFVGAIQAFVFTMLALTYISIGITDEE